MCSEPSEGRPPQAPTEEVATNMAELTAEMIDEWQEQALCRDYDNIIFFGDEGESELEKQGREARAKAICKTCPVLEPCLEFAMETNQKYGIWGGLTAKERASLKRRRARARRAS
jgi:WhiB family redox-sensing transcriptional regulator